MQDTQMKRQNYRNNFHLYWKSQFKVWCAMSKRIKDIWKIMINKKISLWVRPELVLMNEWSELMAPRSYITCARSARSVWYSVLVSVATTADLNLASREAAAPGEYWSSKNITLFKLFVLIIIFFFDVFNTSSLDSWRTFPWFLKLRMSLYSDFLISVLRLLNVGLFNYLLIFCWVVSLDHFHFPLCVHLCLMFRLR